MTRYCLLKLFIFGLFYISSAQASNYPSIAYENYPERPPALVEHLPVQLSGDNVIHYPWDYSGEKISFNVNCTGNPDQKAECFEGIIEQLKNSDLTSFCVSFMHYKYKGIRDGAAWDYCDVTIKKQYNSSHGKVNGFCFQHLAYKCGFILSARGRYRVKDNNSDTVFIINTQIERIGASFTFWATRTNFSTREVEMQTQLTYTPVSVSCPNSKIPHYTGYDLGDPNKYSNKIGGTWDYMGTCGPTEGKTYELLNLQGLLSDFFYLLNGNYWISNENWLNSEISTCDWSGISCWKKKVPLGLDPTYETHNKLYPKYNEFKNIILEIDLSGNNLVGSIPDSFYYVLESLLEHFETYSYSNVFTWNLGAKSSKNNPLPDTVITNYPLLLEKLKATPSLITKLGDKVCYPDTQAFATAFTGTDWFKYACGTETESCPVENTGPECLSGNPINARTGVKMQSATDYAASGTSPLKVKRSYSSSNDASKRQWQFSTNSKSLLISDNYVKLKGRNNANNLFECSSTIPSSCSPKKLIGQSTIYSSYKLNKLESGYQLTLPSGAIENYSTAGKLTSSTNAQGRTLSYSYDSNTSTITDEFSQSITLTVNPDFNNRVEQTVTPIGTFTYSYDEFGRLTTVTQPDATTMGYRYDEAGYSTVQYNENTDENSEQSCSGDDYLTIDVCKALVKNLGLLTGKIDEKGQRVASWYYDGEQRAYKSDHGTNIDTTEIRFVNEQGENIVDAQGNSVSSQRVRDTISPLGLRTRTTFRAPFGQRAEKIETFDSNDNLITTETYAYDSNGYESEHIDIDGLKTTYNRYNDGRESSRTEYAGTEDARTISTSYSGSTNKPTRITSPETTIDISYINHNSGLLVSSQTTTDSVTNEKRTTSFTYENGQLTSTNGPRTDVNDITTYEYNAQGLRTKTTNALGQYSEITAFSAYGKPTNVIDENGITTTLTYDVMGRVTEVQRAGTTQSFDYDVNGTLITSTLANGSEIHYEYDSAQRLTAMRDSLGNRIEYTLDAAGNKLTTQIKDSSDVLRQSQQQLYDEFNRLVTITNGTSNSTQLDYLTNGSLDKTTDALSSQTDNNYDALQRLKEIHDPENGKTEFSYDNAGRTTSITDATGKATTYTYNGFGELTKQISPDTGETTFTYDKAGNLTSETDARGVTVTYQYDALNRITHISYPNSSENISFSYDDTNDNNKGVGRLTSVTETAGNRQYTYGELGQLLTESYAIDSQNYNLSYLYDNASQLTGITYPSGRTVDYTLNSLGQISNITSTASGENQNAKTLISNATYLPFGPISAFTFGNGLVNSFTFDNNYRLSTHTLTGLKNQTLSYTDIGNIKAITDSVNTANNRTFGYDKLSRLLNSSDGSEAGSSGNISFGYDGVGNRLTKTDGPISESYSYVENTHHLAKVTIADAVTKPSLASTFNQARRMASIVNGGISAQYQYNYRQLRVSKTIAVNNGEEVNEGVTSTSTHYHYDANGLLIAESNESGVWQKEYVYFNGQLVAMFDYTVGIASEAYTIHTDHLGTPNQITDNTGALVWQANYTPFGLATINNDVDGNSTPVKLNIRFPGQYYDAESQLHYNWHRYYDPSIGRYITSDPLGLAAGINTYGYVEGNPINLTDPQGLMGGLGSIVRGSRGIPVGGATGVNQPGAATPSLPIHIQNAINGSSSRTSNMSNSTEASCEEEDKDRCTATDSREEAKRKAYFHAGLDNFTSKKEISWRELRNKGDKEIAEAYLKLLTQGVTAMGYYNDDDGSKAIVTEHPAGHPHQRGKKDPNHHWCSHFHAKNKFGMEEVFPYKKI